MSTFVLVHGAWQSNGTWDLLAPLLVEHGHRVITPVLSGLGTDQSRLSPDITLRQHVEDVSVELSKSSDPVILVGHSYAGMIISGVVETNPAQARRLVFLDAFIPENGQSVLDLLPPELGTYFRGVARDHGDGWRLPGGEDNLISGDLSPARHVSSCARGYAILVCVALRRPSVFRQSEGQHSGDLRCQRCGRISARPFFAPFAAKARASGWEVTELKTGHDCHVESPGEVANILLSQ